MAMELLDLPGAGMPVPEEALDLYVVKEITEFIVVTTVTVWAVTPPTSTCLFYKLFVRWT